MPHICIYTPHASHHIRTTAQQWGDIRRGNLVCRELEDLQVGQSLRLVVHLLVDNPPCTDMTRPCTCAQEVCPGRKQSHILYVNHFGHLHLGLGFVCIWGCSVFYLKSSPLSRNTHFLQCKAYRTCQKYPSFALNESPCQQGIMP